MTEDRRLREKLAKLAAGAEALENGRRRLSPPPGGDLLTAILSEIDETILGRRITFEAEDGRQLAVEVANRRLLRLVYVPPDTADTPGLFDPLGQDSDEVLPAVVAAMRRLAEEQNSLLVATAPLDGASEPDVLGRSVAALARVAETEAPSGTADAGGGFAASISGLATALRRFDPSPSAPSGAQAARLEALDEDALAAIVGRVGPQDARAGRFILLSAGTDADALFIGCESEDMVLAALVPAAQSGEVISLWRAASSAA